MLSTPLQHAMLYFPPWINSCTVIDTFRLLIDYGDGFEYLLDERRFIHDTYPVSLDFEIEACSWLWHYAATVLCDPDLLRLRMLLLGTYVAQYRFDKSSKEDEELTINILALVDEEIKAAWSQGKFTLIKNFLRHCNSSLDSQRLGGIYLDLLLRLGLDVEACVAKELEYLSESLANPLCPFFSWKQQKIVFERLDGHDWCLRWEWILDPREPGYLVVSEHTGLGPDIAEYHADQWPFYDGLPLWEEQEILDKRRKTRPRFERRMATKARKERARTGQKKTRSRMPGAYYW
jgi:hypothetical protein